MGKGINPFIQEPSLSTRWENFKDATSKAWGSSRDKIVSKLQIDKESPWSEKALKYTAIVLSTALLIVAAIPSLGASVALLIDYTKAYERLKKREIEPQEMSIVIDGELSDKTSDAEVRLIKTQRKLDDLEEAAREIEQYRKFTREMATFSLELIQSQFDDKRKLLGARQKELNLLQNSPSQKDRVEIDRLEQEMQDMQRDLNQLKNTFGNISNALNQDQRNASISNSPGPSRENTPPSSPRNASSNNIIIIPLSDDSIEVPAYPPPPPPRFEIDNTSSPMPQMPPSSIQVGPPPPPPPPQQLNAPKLPLSLPNRNSNRQPNNNLPQSSSLCILDQINQGTKLKKMEDRKLKPVEKKNDLTDALSTAITQHRLNMHESSDSEGEGSDNDDWD